jgi:hypothetical protein
MARGRHWVARCIEKPAVKKLERGKRNRKDIEGLLSFEVAAA